MFCSQTHFRNQRPFGRLTFIPALAALIGVTAVGCGPSSESKSKSNLAGEIKINGSSTVLPITNAVKEKFNKEYPDVKITVDGKGTGTGFEQFQNKATDISDASRPIKPGEFAGCLENGVEFVEIPVAYDGLTIVVHPNNTWVDTLTIDQLRKIFLAESAAKNWNDVDPSWPDKPIDIYSPGRGSGTYDYFDEVVVGDSDAVMREDMNLNEDDNVLVDGVAGNEYALGFFGVAYYEESKDKLKAVGIVNPKDGKEYLPTPENIASGAYAPFSRPLLIYVSKASTANPAVSTFVAYFLANVQELCERVGYVRLPDEIMERGISNYQEKLVGTHYIDAEGNSRSGAVSDIYVPENLTQSIPTPSE